MMKVTTYIDPATKNICVIDESSTNYTIAETKEHKHFSCQTDLDYSSHISIPIFFCTLHASYNEAATQCSIPQSEVEKRKTSSHVGVEEKYQKVQGRRHDEKLLQQTINEVIRNAVEDDTSDVGDFGDVGDIEVEETCDVGDNNAGAVHGKVRWDSYEAAVQDLEEFLAEHTSGGSSPSHSAEPETDENEKEDMNSKRDANKKTGKIKNKKRKKAGDDEFSSDDDTEFWKKIARVRKKSNWYEAKPAEPGMPEGPDDVIPSLADDVIEEDATSECNVEQGKDWITDDEEDDEVVDFDAAFREELKRKRLPAYSKERPFMCDVCGRQFSKSHILREHIVKTHGDHPEAQKFTHQCTHCRRVYAGARQLQVHSTQFAGPCERCGLVLGCSGLFWLHRLSHETRCDQCDKTFHTKANLYQHVQIKHREKQFQCTICFKKYAFRSQLKVHMKSVHNPDGKDFQCELCSFTTKKRTALKAHIRSTHKPKVKVKRSGDKATAMSLKTNKKSQDSKLTKKQSSSGQILMGSYICEMCHVSFSSQKGLRVHIRRCHDMGECSPPRQSDTEPTHSSDDVTLSIDVRNSGFAEVGPACKAEPVADGSADPAMRCALSLPAYVVPPGVNMVEIDGVQYQVIRANQ